MTREEIEEKVKGFMIEELELEEDDLVAEALLKMTSGLTV